VAFVRRVSSKRSRKGLFAGRNVLSGNNVSDDGGNRYVLVTWPEVTCCHLGKAAVSPTGKMARCAATTSVFHLSFGNAELEESGSQMPRMLRCTARF